MTRTISNPEDHIGYWLKIASTLSQQSFAASLDKYGISVAQWGALRVLFNHDDLSLNEASALVGVDNSSLSRMVERLVGKGLIKRTVASEDRRTIRLELTPEGRKLVPRLAREADKNDRVFFQVLPVRKQKEFISTLKKILAANGWHDSPANGEA